MTPAEHKKLLVRKQDLENYIRASRKGIQDLSNDIARHSEELKRIEDLMFMNPVDVTISEHAILRYLERVQGMDMEDLQRQIREEFELDASSYVGGDHKIVRGDWRLIMKDNTLVTIEPAKRGK